MFGNPVYAAAGCELNWMLLVGHHTPICPTARQQGADTSDLSSASKRFTLTHDESHVARRHHGVNSCTWADMSYVHMSLYLKIMILPVGNRSKLLAGCMVSFSDHAMPISNCVVT